MRGHFHKKAEYAAFIASADWKKIRKRALRRAGSACERCGSQDQVLHVHHRSYARFGGNELPGDLEVLCVPCHEAQHSRSFSKKRSSRLVAKARSEQRVKEKKRRAELRRKIRAPKRLLSDPNR